MPPRRTERRRDAPVADDGQAYARVVAMLGNGRVTARFADGAESQCRIRGSMRRREWVHVGDLVLVARRDDLAGDKADIVFRYLPAEVAKLKKMGECVDIAATADDEDDVVVFERAEDDDIEWDAV